MNDNQQYLLYMDFAPTRAEVLPRAPHLSLASSVPAAMGEMMSTPNQQFHPKTAKAAGSDHYVKATSIIDLGKGQHIMGLYHLPAKEADNAPPAVYLVLEPVAPVSLLKADLFGLYTKEMEHSSAIIDFLQYSGASGKLEPTLAYQRIAKANKEYSALKINSPKFTEDAPLSMRAIWKGTGEVKTEFTFYKPMPTLSDGLRHMSNAVDRDTSWVSLAKLDIPLVLSNISLIVQHGRMPLITIDMPSERGVAPSVTLNMDKRFPRLKAQYERVFGSLVAKKTEQQGPPSQQPPQPNKKPRYYRQNNDAQRRRPGRG